jgi:preprotein translocase subunit SecG
MYQFLLLIHVLIAICMVVLVLVQQGKGATMGAAFGSGASQTVFGSRGSGSFLFRVTIGLAAVFFATSIGLNSLAMRAYKQEKSMTLPFVPAGPVVPSKAKPAAGLAVPSSLPSDGIPTRK